MNDNPFAAPPAEVQEQVTASSIPLTAFFYAFTVFCVGAIGGAFGFVVVLAIPVSMGGLPMFAMFPMAAAGGILVGLLSGRRMYCRLADLHRRKVAWERDLAERTGGKY